MIPTYQFRQACVPGGKVSVGRSTAGPGLRRCRVGVQAVQAFSFSNASSGLACGAHHRLRALLARSIP